VVCHKPEVHLIPGILIGGPTDAVGAGDTATATLAACLASGINCVQAACLANIAASIIVRTINQTGAPPNASSSNPPGKSLMSFIPAWPMKADRRGRGEDRLSNRQGAAGSADSSATLSTHGRRRHGRRGKSPRLRRPLRRCHRRSAAPFRSQGPPTGPPPLALRSWSAWTSLIADAIART
jgi:hypothetical protein